MKKSIGLVVILIFFYSCVTTGTGKMRKTNKYEHWLNEEVSLLITKEEKDTFFKLNTDKEKEKFIEVFWARRDPSPGTKENEFKNEWYQRLEHVNKTFTYGSKKGWRSDVGRVYMFFGPPTQTSATAPRTREDPIGGSQQEPASQIWIYQPMPDLGLTSSFRVIFREYQFGYDLDHQTPQKIVHALEIFPKVVIFNPDIKDIPRYKFSLNEDSFEGKLIKDFIITENEVKEISLEWRPIFTRALNKSIHVSFFVKIDPQQLNEKELREVTFFGKIKGEEVEEDFLQSTKTEKVKGDLLATFGLPITAGKFTLYFGVSDRDKKNYSLLKSDLEVPNFWDGELNTSTIILSSDVKSISKAEKESEFNPYIIGQYKATPQWSNIFKPSESLNVLFYVYNAQLKDNKISLKIEYFITSDEVAYRLNPQEIKEAVEPEKALAGGTQVLLSPLKPGKYTFKIKITDMNSNKSIEKKTDFIVE